MQTVLKEKTKFSELEMFAVTTYLFSKLMYECVMISQMMTYGEPKLTRATPWWVQMSKGKPAGDTCCLHNYLLQQMHNKKMFDFQKCNLALVASFHRFQDVGQGHNVQHSQWCHSMANT